MAPQAWWGDGLPDTGWSRAHEGGAHVEGSQTVVSWKTISNQVLVNAGGRELIAEHFVGESGVRRLGYVGKTPTHSVLPTNSVSCLKK